MTRDGLRDRIVDQFSYRGGRADIWRAFDRFLETDAFLNLGYSKRYRPHVLGSSQRRLAAILGDELADRLDPTDAGRLVDVGCGRGGPAIHLARRYGFDVIGVDLVPYNVETARENARGARVPVEFLIADASGLPIRPGAAVASVALDSIVYVPEKTAVFEEVARVVAPEGPVVVTDLVRTADATPDERQLVEAFAADWDMPPIVTLAAYRSILEDAGLAVTGIRDLTPHSIGRFRKWTWLFLAVTGRAGGLLDPLYTRWGLDPGAVTAQIRRAHDALPHLRHVLVTAETR